MIREITDKAEKSTICAEMLRSLPDWFGLEHAILEYVENCQNMPFWAYFKNDEAKGFSCLKETGRHTAEVYVMAVKAELHRQGIGKALYNYLEKYAVQKKYRFLQVKTVKMGEYKEYDITNSFYIAMGFEEFECLPDLWDKHNPCQIYVKYIGQDI